MAKQCKIIHINDGTAKVLENGNRHFVEEFDWTAAYLQPYLDEGYEVKHMVPEVTPAIQKDGAYSFYKSGFTFYLERDEAEDDLSLDAEEMASMFAAFADEDMVDIDDLIPD